MSPFDPERLGPVSAIRGGLGSLATKKAGYGTQLRYVRRKTGGCPQIFVPRSSVPGGTKLTLGGSGQDDGDFVGVVRNLADATIGAVNELIEATGGKVHATSTLFVQFSVWRDSRNKMGGGDQVFEQSLIGDAADESSVTSGAWNQSGGTRVEAAAIALLKRTEIRGGNLYIKRAIANTQATSLQQLYGEIAIANDYARYLADRGTIDAIIELQPDSAFAAGWIITLIKAQELGLDQQNRTDFIGGQGSGAREFLKLRDAANDNAPWSDAERAA